MRKTFHFLKWSGQKAILYCILTAVLATAVVGSTLAMVITRTQTINNIFRPAEIEISSWSGNDIINSGTVPAYVRAAVVVTWVSESNPKEILSISPEKDADYTLTLSDGWFEAGDGFYYYREPVPAARSLTLIENFEQVGEMEGHILNVQIVSSAIQTNPTEAVESSWYAVDVAQDGTLVEAN